MNLKSETSILNISLNAFLSSSISSCTIFVKTSLSFVFLTHFQFFLFLVFRLLDPQVHLILNTFEILDEMLDAFAPAYT